MDSMGSEEQLSERVAVMQSRSQQAQDQALVRKMKVLDNTEVEKERLSTMLTAQAAQNSLLVLLEDLLKDHTCMFLGFSILFSIAILTNTLAREARATT